MLKSKLALTTATAAALFAAMPSTAAVLVANTGWADDELDSSGQPTDGSPWTFTIATSAIFSVVDCCVAGDVYTVRMPANTIIGTTTFYSGLASDVQASTAPGDDYDYGALWLDNDYSKIALVLGPGSYSLTIRGNGAGGLPAHLGVRLDTLSAVPEPAAWALMMGGFAIAGAAMRRRRTAVSFV